jgi:hypothetical protein
MGDCSGAAFYSALNETLSRLNIIHTTLPPHTADAYHTWDSRALPISLVQIEELPPEHLVNHLIDVFHHHCSSLFRLVDPDDFDVQLQAFRSNTVLDRNRSSTLCQLYMILAIGCLHLDRSGTEQFEDPAGILHLDPGTSASPGLTFFARGTFQLPALERDLSVASVVALSLAVGDSKARLIPGVLPPCRITPRRRVRSCRWLCCSR